MIPSTDALLLQELDTAQAAETRTFALKRSGRDETEPTGRVQGMLDGKAALLQTVWQILNTERYEWLIFSWNYGVEFRHLFGKDPAWCVPEIERCTEEALLQDDRITGVDGFSFEISRRKVQGTFTVHTIYGDLESGVEVEI